ncbi:MAG: aminotransferase class I/II-fold pyridoxal phosphate-dependent enzyme [Anaerolineae bacterium]|jgi:aspartate/methionine/tyrosine aminotransferase|nr:aminotransferase class I/II-fold pyridoxal phosphate-dependent enzyme [Anaerolineae bacterium]MBT7071665.1 aminotransferase class I/II-fold pyridoxal phosphate-dependent enzyme [Anaerolineae bacterium]MBT7325145.1 aminotransferase class I/II-fold pyridoxal phosphate-dependent enzyme [Anaerolineae bacterium]
MSKQKINVNQNILNMEYAVRGPIPQRAAKLKEAGKEIIFCNIGNPQALGQAPITYYREVISLLEEPSKISRERELKSLFEENSYSNLRDEDFIAEDLLALSEKILAKTGKGLGAYTESKGFRFVREAIANFINKRDGFNTTNGLEANPDHIFLTDGASDGAKRVLNLLIAKKTDGVMIPIPQYPLYSASIKAFGGNQVNYYPDEDRDWALDRAALESAYNTATEQGTDVKVIVVINPGNPTGAILDSASIHEVVAFAKAHQLAIIADEVYQENVYGGEFISFAKALENDKDVLLFSLHSISKGFYGECGHRGGYLEVRNVPQVEGAEMDFVDLLLKQASVSLCANTVGQIITYLMVSPPNGENAALEQFHNEKEKVLGDLYEKASMVRAAFAQMEGVEVFGKTGAMYLFPRLNKLPAGTTDFDYCMALLEETGLCTVNGSGFGQAEGTHHLRIAFLPSKEELEDVLPKWVAFHNRYVNG